MKFGNAWTSVNKPRRKTPAPPPEKRARHYRPAGLPAEFELRRLTPTGLFLLVGRLQKFGSDERPACDPSCLGGQ